MEGDPTRTIKVETSRIRPGQTLAGKYRVVREIGRGGMGVVYEAEDLKLKRTVALKFLPPGLTADPESRERFVHEAQAASGLDHPNICNIHEIDEAEAGGMYIAMAFYRGESLKDRIARGPLEPGQAVDIAAQIAEGLAKAHSQGLVHRDIKPGNIMVTAEGVAKILDFGLAKLAGEARLTLPGTTLGTVAYMSPEQARGDEVDARTDVWSLGVVLYEMATGSLPFRGEKEAAVVHAILHEPPRPVRDLPRGYPPEFARVLHLALAKDPAKRYASAREMAEALLDLKPRMAGRTAATVGRVSFRSPRRRWLFAAGAVSLAAVAVAVWLLSRPSLAFEKRDKVMVADAENLTGDKVFDLALRTAIEAGLQQSPYAAVFDKGQIAETLRLMRVDPAARIDERLGSDICRFAGVRAFILPRILAAGEAYELEAILVDPLTKRQVDRVRVTAKGREAVMLKGIDQLTGRLRSRLGESLGSIEKAARPVATVTTSSWEALDYFSLAQVKREQGKFKEAVTLYELALDKDPKFVAARSSLALVLIQFMNQRDKGKDMLRQALKDATDQQLLARDLLPLKAVCRQFVDEDLEGALAEYRTVIELFPDLMPPYNNSGRILQALKRYDEAAAMFEKAAERAPRNSIPLMNLWYLYYYSKRDIAAAERTVRRYAALALDLANSHALLGYCLAVQEKFPEAEKELRKAIELEPSNPYALPNLAHMLLAAGRPAEAVPIYRKVGELGRPGGMGGDPEVDAFDLAVALAAAGDRDEAVKVAADAQALALKNHGPGQPDAEDFVCLLGKLCAVQGQTDRARDYLNRALTGKPRDGDSLVDLAGLYACLGETQTAVATLQKALEKGYRDPRFPVILPEFQSLRQDQGFRKLFGLGT